jgi:crossover junction endodeoxyribonuclease RuvC
MDNFFAGVDPSLTGTGVIVIDQDKNIIDQELISTTNKDSIEKRLIYIRRKLLFIPKIIRLKSVYIEGLSYGSKGDAALQLGALHFIIRMMFYEKKLNYKIIAPKTLKKFHTGFGNTVKKDILEKVDQTLGVRFDDHNIADAYGLARLALEDFKNE